MATTGGTKRLHRGLWVVQGLLALTFLMSGLMHLVEPTEALQAQTPWFPGTLRQLVRTIGTLEVLSAIGLIVPACTRITPSITPLTASGIAAAMAFGGLAAFVAWGRWRKAPIEPRW